MYVERFQGAKVGKNTHSTNLYCKNVWPVVEKALLQSFGIIGYNVEFKDDVKADNYRLFQLTDFVCSIKLIEKKMNCHELSFWESVFFNDPISFKNYYLKALKKKELK